MITEYVFQKQMDIVSITTLIENSAIITALDHVDVVGSETDIWFKDALSSGDQTLLNSIVDNYAPIPQPNHVAEVVTQFEKRDKTIKLANMSGPVGLDGTVALMLKIPGTPNPAGDVTQDGRWVSSGLAFFDVATPGDIITSVRFVDHDNMLGQGVDFVVGSYTDDDLASGNQGWFIPPNKGEIKAEAIGGYGFAPAGYYIMITAKKGGGVTTGTFYVNLEWGKKES
jgi:hypothetical protein